MLSFRAYMSANAPKYESNYYIQMQMHWIILDSKRNQFKSSYFELQKKIVILDIFGQILMSVYSICGSFYKHGLTNFGQKDLTTKTFFFPSRNYRHFQTQFWYIRQSHFRLKHHKNAKKITWKGHLFTLISKILVSVRSEAAHEGARPISKLRLY